MADFVFTSNEGYRVRAHTRTQRDTHIDTCAHKTHMKRTLARRCVLPQRPLPSCYHVSARALATASERVNKKERSWREQGTGEWVKRGREKEMRGRGELWSINKWWVQQCELLLVSIAAAPLSFAWQHQEQTPLLTPFPLSLCISPSHGFFLFPEPFYLFLSFPHLRGLVNISKYVYLFLVTFFIFFFFMSDLFVSFSEPPLWLQHHYINIIIFFFTAFLFHELSCYRSFLLYLTIICWKWQPYTTGIYLASPFLHPFIFCLQLLSPFHYILKKRGVSSLWGNFAEDKWCSRAP